MFSESVTSQISFHCYSKAWMLSDIEMRIMNSTQCDIQYLNSDKKTVVASDREEKLDQCIPAYCNTGKVKTWECGSLHGL